MNDHQLIWARCHTSHDIRTIAAFEEQLREDGDPFAVMTTMADGPDGVVAPPIGRRQVQTFLGLYEPELVLWVGGAIDATTLQACDHANIPSIVVNGSSAMFDDLPRAWLPHRRRALVASFASILTLDDAANNAAIKAGAVAERVHTTGPLAETARILPYDEDDRSDFALALGSRPVWLGAAVSQTGIIDLVQAHKEATRRAHRLLLVISPQTIADIPAIKKHCFENGFRTALRSDTLVPGEEIQIYIADTPDELGLWHRISPITYLDGSLDEGARVDPYTVAALGSVVVHGPNGGAWHDQLNLLRGAGASQPVASPDVLGKTITSLLSAERTAMLVHAGWDITTRGAIVSETLINLTRETLETRAH